MIFFNKNKRGAIEQGEEGMPGWIIGVIVLILVLVAAGVWGETIIEKLKIIIPNFGGP